MFFECKNYSSDPKNPEIDQLVGRLHTKRGRLGFLVCRKIRNRDVLIKRCRDILNATNGYVIALEDKDLKMLIEFGSDKLYNAIDDYLGNLYLELLS